MAKQRPTRRQLEVLRAYIDAGSVAAAAYELGISEATVRQRLSGLYRRTGCLNEAQAAYWLGAGRFAAAPEVCAARDEAVGGLDTGATDGARYPTRDGASSHGA